MDQTGDSTPAVRYYVFPPFTVDVLKRVLLRDGVPVHLSSRTFETLLTLLRRHGKIVDKDDLISAIWRDVTVEENNLVRHISTLRRALDETPESHRYVVTVPGRGYSFVADVEAIAGVEPRTGATNPRSPLLLAAAAVLLAAIAGTSIYLLAPWDVESAAAPVERTRNMWQLTFDAGLQGEPSWSPDGATLAYSSDRAGSLDIWVQSIHGDDPLRLTQSAASDSEPDWSPDGTRIAFRSDRDGRGIFVVPATGGAEQRVTSFGRYPRWSPDGTRLLFEADSERRDGRSLFIATLGQHEPQRVLEQFLTDFTKVRAAWHPDARRLSLWGMHRTAGPSFWTVGADGSSPVRWDVDAAVAARIGEHALTLFDEDANPTQFRWAPSGDSLFFEGLSRGVRNIWRIQVDPVAFRWNRGPERLTTAPAVNADVALSTSGKVLAFVSRSERIRIWSFPFDSSTGRVLGDGEPLTSAAVNALAPDLSPDGRRIVYKTEKGAVQEVWEKSLHTGVERTLVKADALERWIFRWTPDERLTYARRVEVGPAGPTEIVSLTPGYGEEVSPLGEVVDLIFDWSPDGTWLVGSQRQAPGRFALRHVMVTEADSESAAVRTLAADAERDLWQARISPNQRWIAYSASRLESSGIQVVAAAGGTPIQVTEDDSHDHRPVWSGDGRLLYFLSNRSGQFNVWARKVDPSTGQPQGTPFRVTHFDQPTHTIPRRLSELALSVGSGRLIVPLADVTSNIWILDGVDR
jgi:Tol biopolymer transport system component/DNA-binding winged helix-turn-helix (wHTH) protein